MKVKKDKHDTRYITITYNSKSKEDTYLMEQQVDELRRIGYGGYYSNPKEGKMVMYDMISGMLGQSDVSSILSILVENMGMHPTICGMMGRNGQPLFEFIMDTGRSRMFEFSGFSEMPDEAVTEGIEKWIKAGRPPEGDECIPRKKRSRKASRTKSSSSGGRKSTKSVVKRRKGAKSK